VAESWTESPVKNSSLRDDKLETSRGWAVEYCKQTIILYCCVITAFAVKATCRLYHIRRARSLELEVDDKAKAGRYYSGPNIVDDAWATALSSPSKFVGFAVVG